MKRIKILRVLAFIANVLGAYYFVNNIETFLVLTAVVVINYMEGFNKGNNFKK